MSDHVEAAGFLKYVDLFEDTRSSMVQWSCIIDSYFKADTRQPSQSKSKDGNWFCKKFLGRYYIWYPTKLVLGLLFSIFFCEIFSLNMKIIDVLSADDATPNMAGKNTTEVLTNLFNFT